MLLNKRKNKCGLKSHPFKQLGTGTWGLIRAGELNYSGKYGTFKFKMGCNLSCFLKLCIGLLKFVQELWCYLVSCTVLTIPDLEDLWESMEWSKFIVIISLTLFVFFIFRMSQYVQYSCNNHVGVHKVIAMCYDINDIVKIGWLPVRQRRIVLSQLAVLRTTRYS